MTSSRMTILFVLALAVPCRAATKPFSFGRFGFSNDDGLLTLNVTPSGFRLPPPCAQLDAAWEQEGKPTVAAIDATRKVVVLPATKTGPNRLVYTLLYPGFAAEWGTRAVITLSGGKAAPLVGVDGAVPSARAGTWTLKNPDVVVAPAGPRSTPIILTFGPPPVRFTVSRSGARTVLTAEGSRPLSLRVTAPTLATTALATTAAVRAFVSIVDTRAPLPRLLREDFRLTTDGKSVLITDTFDPAGGKPVLPPVLGFAQESGYPSLTPVRVDERLLTKYGPITYPAMGGNRVVYAIPVPPTEDRGYLAPAEGDPLLPLLNETCGHWPAEWCRNGVDLAYAGVAPAAMAWNLLDDANRDKARASWAGYLDQAFSLPPYAEGADRRPWRAMTEPYSGKPFLYGYTIDNKTRQNDIDWGIGLPLYGLYRYGRYTGDWGRVRGHWPACKRLANYFNLGDDWAWMTVVNAEDGYSTGTGDALNAAYAGMVAMREMARVLGDRPTEELYAYRVARMALLTALRPAYSVWGRANGFITRGEVALGFWERMQFTTSSYRGDPWGPSTLLSGDGCIPEILGLYEWSQPHQWRNWLTEYATEYPKWYDGAHRYEAEVTYNGNSGYVNYPQVFARAWFGTSQGSLRGWIDRFRTNTNNAWVGPNAIAEVITRTAPMVLTDWGPATFAGTYAANSATVETTCATPFTLLAECRRPVASASVDGKSVPVTMRNTPFGPRLAVKVPGGRSRIVVAFK